MAIIGQKANERNVNAKLDVNSEEKILELSDNSVKSIVKGIIWPKPIQAIKYAFYCMLASAIISLLLYFFGIGIALL